jgi:hypothetical protein
LNLEACKTGLGIALRISVNWTCPRCQEQNRSTINAAGFVLKEQTCATCGMKVEAEVSEVEAATVAAQFLKSETPESTSAEYHTFLRDNTRFRIARGVARANAGLLLILFSVYVIWEVFYGSLSKELAIRDELAFKILVASGVITIWTFVCWAGYQATIVVFDIADALIDIGRRMK